jgi:hypothetical protein
MILEDDHERMLKAALMAYFLGFTWRNCGKSQSR